MHQQPARQRSLLTLAAIGCTSLGLLFTAPAQRGLVRETFPARA